MPLDVVIFGLVGFNSVILLSSKWMLERFSWVMSNSETKAVNVLFKKAGGVFSTYYAEFPQGAIPELSKGRESLVFTPKGRDQKALFDGQSHQVEVTVDPLSGLPVGLATDSGVVFRARTSITGKPVYEKQLRLQRLMARYFACAFVVLVAAGYVVYRKEINWLSAGLLSLSRADSRFEAQIRQFETESQGFPADDLRRWAPSFLQAVHRQEKKQYEKSNLVLNQIVDGRKSVGMRADGVVGLALGMRGRNRVLLGNYSAAADDLRQSASILGSPDLNSESLTLTLVGPIGFPLLRGPSMRIDALRQLAVASEAMGDKKGAEQALADALSFEIARNSNLMVGTAHIDLALFYHRQGDQKKGDEELAAAVSVIDSQSKESKGITSGTWFEYWADRCEQHGDYLYALNLYQRALKARQAEEKPSPGLIGRDFNELGDCYTLIGRFQDAEHAFESGLAEYKKVYGPDHVELTWPKVGMAYAQYRSGKPFPVSYVTTALSQRTKSFGGSSNRVAWVMHQLANYYRDTGDVAKAAELYKKALDIRKDTLRYAHPTTVETMADYARFLTQSGKTDEGEGVEKEAAKLRRLCFI